jgi:hypothetical protein
MTETTTQPDDVSLTAIRRQLNELRRQARQLDRPALEECLSLAVALANPKTMLKT